MHKHFRLLGRAKVQRFLVLGSYFAQGTGAWKLWRRRIGLTPKFDAKNIVIPGDDA